MFGHRIAEDDRLPSVQLALGTRSAGLLLGQFALRCCDDGTTPRASVFNCIDTFDQVIDAVDKRLPLRGIDSSRTSKLGPQSPARFRKEGRVHQAPRNGMCKAQGGKKTHECQNKLGLTVMRRRPRLAALLALVVGCSLYARALAVPLHGRYTEAGHEGGSRNLIIAVRSRISPEQFAHVWAARNAPGEQAPSLDDDCRLGPSRASISAVERWAADHGALEVTATRCSDFLIVCLPEASLPGAFAGAASCGPLGGCDRPAAVPLCLVEHVDFIEGIGAAPGEVLLQSRPVVTSPKQMKPDDPRPREFDPAERRRSAAAHEKTPDVDKGGPWYPACLKEQADPACLKKAYNCSKKAAHASSSSQGVALFGGQFFSPADLAQFENQFKLPKQTVRIMNDNDPSTPGNEASLDVQYITGIGSQVDTVYMHYACTTQDCRPFLSWILEQANSTDPPLVQSVSVGTTEYEYVEAMGNKFVSRINFEFQKAGLRGLSLLFASGDRAVQHYKGKYWVNFPSCSPFVTAVGGVWLGELGGGPVSVDPDTTGGFANSPAHTQQSYQKRAVENYLIEAARTSAKQAPIFNASMRAVPDLSAMSDAYVIVQHGANTFVGGTSAAAPVVAGLISLINSERMTAGKKPMGFLNDFLYSVPHCFGDVTTGENLYGSLRAPFSLPQSLTRFNYHHLIQRTCGHFLRPCTDICPAASTSCTLFRIDTWCAFPLAGL